MHMHFGHESKKLFSLNELQNVSFGIKECKKYIMNNLKTISYKVPYYKSFYLAKESVPCSHLLENRSADIALSSVTFQYLVIVQ